MNRTPTFKEDHISQIPAIQLLLNLGYSYLTPAEALKLRGGRQSEVILDGILEEQLRKNNRIHYHGEEYAFSEGNIQAAIQAIKAFPFDGLIRTNERIFDLLSLGKSFQQSIYGDVKSFQLNYIDWDNPENNVFHVTAEFPVERTGSHETRRPDIVLFVNGIPLVVIECKRPDIKEPMEAAIKQQVRNQKDDEIPKLFLYSQILLGLSKTEAMYATTGTPLKFWSIWREDNIDDELFKLINNLLSENQKERLFSDPFTYMRPYFDELEAQDYRKVTEQDRIIHALCRPERLLEIVYRFILYDAGEKKITRYQQYFSVREIMARISSYDHDEKRQGGVVWHTQGSGKSLTMVMLAKAIALEHDIPNHKIVLVTDRVDLDDQIYKTFLHCGKGLTQARTGKHLIKLVEGHKERIITTVIDKFDAALSRKDLSNDDPNIFVLVDESHRTNYGRLHANMRKVLPNACFIGFTGTPVMKKDKNTILKFGGLIQPAYTISQAVKDKAVVPLLYEGRDVELSVQRTAIDEWFKKITTGLTDEQKTDLKRKFARADQLNRAEQKIMAISWDISTHFASTWQGTGFKAQLVADRKATALQYKHYLNEFDMVASEVLISAPQVSEGEDDIYGETSEPIEVFWKSMMDKYGNEKEYNRQLINAFKHGDEPEIIIVVDKLLTGFDAPRNTVLYLTKKMEGHGLLQAIARVNRLYEGKDFGYVIDYYGVLAKLGEALDLYGSLIEFDEADLYATLVDVSKEVETLPQKHSDLWDIFKGIKNRQDIEAFEQLLAEGILRNRFYEKLSMFARTLSMAMSTLKFTEEASDAKIDRYRNDLKFFMNLRTSVRRRYAEAVDFKQYEKKIQKLIDTHVGAGEVEPITPIVNIFDSEFEKEVEKVRSISSKADSIAHRTKKTISEKWMEDPAFYKKFSELLEEVIRSFRLQRISDAEYLKKVSDIMRSVRIRTGDDTPEQLKPYETAKAFYGVIREPMAKYGSGPKSRSDLNANISLKIDEIIKEHIIINWENNSDVKNIMRNEIEDYLLGLKESHGMDLDFDDIDSIMEDCLEVAKVRYRS